MAPPAHRWAGCKDDEVCLLPAGSEAIQRFEAGRYTGEVVRLLHVLLYLAHGTHHHILQAFEVLAQVLIGNFIQARLCFVQQVEDISAVLPRLMEAVLCNAPVVEAVLV